MRAAESFGVGQEPRRRPAHIQVVRAWAQGAPAVLDPAEVAGLEAALAEIPSPAYVVWADGRIALANAVGRAACDRESSLVAGRLVASLEGRDRTYRVTRILSPGKPSHYLAVQRREPTDPADRLAAAAVKWGATPRQSEVLALLALGKANKTIADALGCAGPTVEVHVSTLLKKSGCESRCELVSRFWSQPIGFSPAATVDLPWAETGQAA
jgi:DNA-binding CsgD family transcriptional regulator